jgi:hypothetical protein
MTPGQVHSWNFTSRVTGYVLNFSAGFFAEFLQDPDYLSRFFFLFDRFHQL